MSDEDVALLERHGWMVECESPFEVRHEDGSFATGQAAEMVVWFLKDDEAWDKTLEQKEE